MKPLDILSGIQKVLKRSIAPPRYLGEEEKEIISIVDSWRRATTPANVTSAFRQAGIYQEKHEGSYVMSADLNYDRAVRGMEHVEAPIPEESIKTEPIKVF